MRWIGYAALFLLSQALLVGIVLVLTGRWPAQELANVWQAVLHPVEPSVVTPAPIAEERPSFEQILQEEARQSAVIQRQRNELLTLRSLLETERKGLEQERQQLEQIRRELDRRVADAKTTVREQGQQAFRQLLEAMPPDLAADTLLHAPNQEMILSTLRQLDPMFVGRLARTAREPGDRARWRQWLLQINAGEPALSRLPSFPALPTSP